jgi:hypothetical protein
LGTQTLTTIYIYACSHHNFNGRCVTVIVLIYPSMHASGVHMISMTEFPSSPPSPSG